jgi:hypothetical protein
MGACFFPRLGPTPKRAIGFCDGFPTRDASAVKQEVRRKWFAQQVSKLRRKPIEFARRRWLSILRQGRHGVRLKEHLEHPDCLTVFQRACKMGLEGIVSKRLGSRYRSGRSPDCCARGEAGGGRRLGR